MKHNKSASIMESKLVQLILVAIAVIVIIVIYLAVNEASGRDLGFGLGFL